MNRFAVIFILTILSLASQVTAQTYESLWEQVKTAQKKDLPRTTIDILHTIIAKAEREHSYGNLFAAITTELEKQNEISLDSVMTAYRRLNQRYESLRKTDEVAANLLCTALYFHWDNGEDFNFPKPDIDSLLASPYADRYTAHNAVPEYVPFVNQQPGSRYFNHDLLSLIGMHTEQYETLRRYYDSVGNEEAVTLLDSKLFLRNYRYTREEKIAYIDSLISKWGKWEGINDLRREREELTSPSFSAQFKKRTYNTEEIPKLHFSTLRNIGKAEVTLVRLNCSSGNVEKYKLDDEKDAARLKKLAVRNSKVTVVKEFEKHKDYEEFEDSITFKPLPLGIYLVEVKTDRANVPVKRGILSVSNLKLLTLSLPSNKQRIAVVDDITGKPVGNATVHLRKRLYRREKQTYKEKHLTTDKNGECIVAEDEDGDNELYPSTVADTAQTFRYTYSEYSFRKPASTSPYVNIYTDRAIYRPGQTVNVALVASDVKKGVKSCVRSKAKLTLMVRDSRYNVVASDTLVTDDYGTAHTSFVLPKNGRNGMYTIFAGNGREVISVEEYVRPTFDVELAEPSVAYKEGDTITVCGKARTYSGVGVAGAKVRYSVSRNHAWWCGLARNGALNERTICNDSVETDADGRFYMRIPLIGNDDIDRRLPYFHNIKVDATVTDMAGESHEALLYLPLSNREAYLSCDVKERILVSDTTRFTVNRYNIAGTKIDGDVAILLDGKHYVTVKANKAFQLVLASGRHEMTAICQGDTLTRKFVAFSLSDTAPVADTPEWWYQSADGSMVQFGTSDRSVHVLYTIVGDDHLVESETMSLDSALVTRSFDKELQKYNAMAYSIAWVKDGETHSHTFRINKPLESKPLDVKWESFRNRLEPGNNETWTLRITHPDGTPARAQMMATLYDKSLDALLPHSWMFNDRRYQPYIGLSWSSLSDGSLYLSGRAAVEKNKYKELKFSHFGRYVHERGEVDNCEVLPNSMAKASPMMARANVRKMASMEMSDGIADRNYMDNEAENEAEKLEEEYVVSFRTNLSETAYFIPAAEADENGIVSLKFTLPESVTTWRFMGLAHDKELNTGLISDEAVAQKKLMVQPRVPRFLREGDKASIAATVSNLTDKDMKVKVVMTILNNATNSSVYSHTETVEVKANDTAPVMFGYDAVESIDAVVRFTAVGDGFTDGEQHLMPVLSAKEMIVNTLPLVITERGKTSVTIEELLPADIKTGNMTVSYTDKPEWLLIKSLPYVKEDVDDNAVSLAASLYTNTLAACIADSNSETMEMYDKAYIETRATEIIERLEKLQLANGGWSWWKGMYCNRYITMEVVKMLQRMICMTGRIHDVEDMLNHAFEYLDNQVREDIKQMKKTAKDGEKPFISKWLVDYLYCQSLAGRKQNTDYLISLLSDESFKTTADMETKAVATVILSRNGRNELADEFMESIMQHTVYRKDIGRYFDSPRARYSWCDYRIPTHTSVVEALSLPQFKENRKQEVRDMRRWLLASKRTQSWDTPINAVNAIYAFFGNSISELERGTEAVISLDGKRMNASSATVSHKNKTLNIEKQSDGESWAAVSLAFEQDLKNIEASASGLTIERKITGDTSVGNKVKVEITVIADRDYDFVSITDNRAACLEPVYQLSGYRNGAYVVKHDSATTYYFEMLSKGTHRIETEYYVTRPGEYQTGTAEVTCTYAPEFCGRSRVDIINSKK